MPPCDSRRWVSASRAKRLIYIDAQDAQNFFKDGITVNAICPGPVQTEMNDRRIQYDSGRLGIEFSELEARLTPIGRRLQPREIVPMAILLASDESAAITGQAFNICGGMNMA